MTSTNPDLDPNADPLKGFFRSPTRYVGGVFLLTVAYQLIGSIGLAFAELGQHGIHIGPSIGVGVAFLFRLGLRFWPAVFLGALLVNLSLVSWPVAVGIAAASTLGTTLAAWLLRVSEFSPSFSRLRDVGVFVSRPIPAVLVSAATGTACLAFGGAIGADAVWSVLLIWWLCDVARILVIAPVFLTFQPVRISPRRFFELVGVLLVVCIMGVMVFDPFGFEIPRLSLSFLSMLALVWVALRYPLPVSSASVLIMSALAMLGTSRGRGAFFVEDPLIRLVVIWAFATTAAIITQVIASLLAEYRAVANELAATAAEYRAIVDDAPALICRYTPDGTITFANEPLCRFLGRPCNHVVGGSVLEFLPQLPIPDTHSELALQAVAETLISRVGPLVRVDGIERWYRWGVRTSRDVGNRTAEFHAVGVDITDRRRADETQRALERKILETQRLESLGLLAGGIAHDFNNLLASILGHVELIQGQIATESPIHPHSQEILASVKAAGGLTHQLLAYSGKGKFLIRQVDLSDIVRQMEALLRASVPSRVEIQFQLLDDLPPIAADPTQIRQVLLNLVINAGESLGERTGTIHISTTGVELGHDELPDSYLFDPLSPGPYVMLEVVDAGIGMDETTRERLFDPFFSTKFAGRGLGMAAVLGIVRAHHGGIRVDSHPGSGTRIATYIPVSLAPPLELIATDARPPLQDTRPDAPGSGSLVLVVDDEFAVRRVAQLMLRQLGYDVIAISDSLDAVSQVERNQDRICALLLDLTMPRMDGPEVLAEIRKVYKTIPVILCSGYCAEAVPESLGSLPNVSFLQKPFSMSDLSRAMAEAIGTARS